MKHSKSIIFITLITGMIIGGCSKELNVSPQNAIPQGSLGATDIAQLRTGMYAIMEDVTFSFYFDFDKRGENLIGQAVPIIDPIAMTPSDADIATMWQNAYKGINTINFLIGAVNNLGNGATTAMLAYKGEALYFRALMYYNLVTRWGGVPIVLTNTNDPIQRSTEAQVWTQIKSDLTTALPLVSTFSNDFYVSDVAVKALMAKVYLATGDNSNAILMADAVITSNKFALSTDALSYSGIFVSGSTSKEIIFALANNSTANTHLFLAYTNDTKASWIYSPSPFNFANLFLDNTTPVIKGGDRRKAATFSTDAARIIKYPNGKTGQQLAPTTNANATPIVLARISEMYLIKAEAQGAAAGAATLAPYFAARYDTPPTTATVAALTTTQYQDLILNENRREFYAEGYWWYDLKRTNRVDLLTTLAGRTYLLYYPVPQVQRDLAGYIQNPGYGN